MKTAREFIERVTDLPSLPAVYFRVRSVIERPDSCAVDVAREIMCDPGLTLRLLRIANGTFYGMARKVESITDAIAILGVSQIHNIVLATSVTTAFAGVAPPLMNMSKFWRTSVYRALVARCLAQRSRHVDSERAFLGGLIADIGHLVMYEHVPDAAERSLQIAAQTAQPLNRVERGMLGFDYGEIGAELVARWNLSASIEAALRHHTEPSQAADSRADASVLHIATRFAIAAFNSEPAATWLPQIDPLVWQVAGVSDTCVPEIKQEADRELEALAQAILPGFGAMRRAA